MGIGEAFLRSEGKCGIAELNRGKERVMVKEEKVLLLLVFKQELIIVCVLRNLYLEVNTDKVEQGMLYWSSLLKERYEILLIRESHDVLSLYL